MRTNVRAYTRSTNKRSGRVPDGHAETDVGVDRTGVRELVGGRTGVRIILFVVA